MTTTPAPAVTAPQVDLAPPGMATLVAVELRKAVDTVTGRWLLGITALLVLAALALVVAVTPEEDFGFVTFFATASLPLSLLLPVIGVLLVSGEFSQRTTLTTFALVPSRARFVLAKTLAGLVLALVGALLTLLATAAATGIATGLYPDTSWSVSVPGLLQLVLAQLVYVLVGVAFGLLCQNTPLGVVTYLLLPTLLSPVLFLVPSWAEAGGWIDFGTATLPLTSGAGLTAGEWARVGTATALWFGVPFVLGWLRLTRREIA